MPFQRRLIEIETEEYGTIHLAAHLTIGNIQAIGDPKSWNSRELIVNVLGMLILSPNLELDSIRSWDDHLIEKVARIWLKDSNEKWEIQEDIPFFEAFQHGCEAYVNALHESMQEAYRQMLTSFSSYAPILTGFQETLQDVTVELGRQLNESARAMQHSFDVVLQSISGIQETINHIFESSRIEIPPIKIGWFFESLPDITELTRSLETAGKVKYTLNRAGYRFMFDYLTLEDIARLVHIDQVDTRVRNAAITNRLLGKIRKIEFVNTLEELFQTSSVQKRRWHIVKQALRAHNERNYVLSIPTLFAQIEGMLTDALVFKGLALKSEGKIYAKDSTGNLKLDKNSNKIELKGLVQKAEHLRSINQLLLQDLVNIFITGLASERNDILHGNHIKYNSAKRSLHLILVIFVLVAEFVEFENRN